MLLFEVVLAFYGVCFRVKLSWVLHSHAVAEDTINSPLSILQRSGSETEIFRERGAMWH